MGAGAGGGSGAAFSKADDLAKKFPPGKSLAAGSGYVVISKATIGNKQPSSKADWFVIPLIIIGFVLTLIFFPKLWTGL